MSLDSYILSGQTPSRWGRRTAIMDFSLQLASEESFKKFLLKKPKRVPTLLRVSDISIKSVTSISLLKCHFETPYGEKEMWIHHTFLDLIPKYKQMVAREDKRLRDQIANYGRPRPPSSPAVRKKGKERAGDEKEQVVKPEEEEREEEEELDTEDEGGKEKRKQKRRR